MHARHTRRSRTAAVLYRRSIAGRWRNHLTLTLLLFAFVLCSLLCSLAANPPNGAISTLGPTLSWQGTATDGTYFTRAPLGGEELCQEGVDCDTFTLTVTGLPAAWAAKQITINIGWMLPANDYDLFVHKDSNAGPLVGSSARGADSGPAETVTIRPSVTGVGVYTIHVVYFNVLMPASDQYTGTAQVEDAPVIEPQERSAVYLRGGIAFSRSSTVRAPVANADAEPSSRTDKFGNHYIAGIRGVPAGTDLWYFDLRPTSLTYDPFMRNPIYRGQPDSFTEDESLSVGADGGGDIDLAVGFDNAGPNSPPYLAAVSLTAANISAQRSGDLGITFDQNAAGNVTGGIPADDRQWIEFYGPNKVYLLYRTLAPAVTMIQRSNDGGLTYGLARTAGAIGQTGSIDVHQATGTVYISGSTGQVAVGIPPAPTPLDPDPEPLTYNVYQVTNEASVANIFFVVKVADDGTANGTAYVVYSNGQNVYLRHSSDQGVTWSKPVRVNDGDETRTCLLPWIETGPTRGSVGIAWYGTSAAGNIASANWKVFYAQSFNATSNTPTFRQVTATEHHIHAGIISTGGTLGDQNRNLLDYFQVSFDPTGAAILGFSSDHNDFDGHCYVTRQISGPSITGNDKQLIPIPIEGPNLPPPPGPPADGAQVTDFPQDVAVGLLGVVPLNDPLDILSIKYRAEGSTTSGDAVIVATMRVSDLDPVPALSNWRMVFVANVPFTDTPPQSDFNFGLSDRGDQFYLQATTDAAGVQTFTYGTAARNADGSLTYTSRGAADCGSQIDPLTNTITVKLEISKLNMVLSAGGRPLLAEGSVVAGLRGQAFTSGNASGKRDITRGGGQFLIGSGNAAITGTLTLEDCASMAVPITFELRPLDGCPILTRTVTPNPNGVYQLTDVPAKRYNVAIKGSKWLRVVAPTDAEDGTGTIAPVLLLGGDADNSNIVEVNDLAELIAAFDATPADPNWNEGRADFNCNDIVDVEDLDILIRNFDKEGAE